MKNKKTNNYGVGIPPETVIKGFHKVAVTGNYNDLNNKPDIDGIKQEQKEIKSQLEDIKTTVGDETQGLVKDVNDLKNNQGGGFSGNYNDLTGIPSSFTPSSHRHDASEIDNLPSGGGSGSSIDDVNISTSKVWSSSKTQEEIKKIPKGDKGDSGTASTAIDDTKTNTEQTWTSSKILNVVSSATKKTTMSCSLNVLDLRELTRGKQLVSTTGDMIDKANCSVTGFINLEPATKYSRQSLYDTQICFYDIEKNFISGTHNNSTITTPVNCFYARVTVANSVLNTEMMWKGEPSDVPSTYESFYSEYSIGKDTFVVSDNIKDNEVDIYKLKGELIKSGNIYNSADITEKNYLNQSGGLVAHNDYFCTGKIRVKKGFYTINKNMHTSCMYDDKDNFISTLTFIECGVNKSFQIPSDDVSYIKLSGSNSNKNTLVCIEGKKEVEINVVPFEKDTKIVDESECTLVVNKEKFDNIDKEIEFIKGNLGGSAGVWSGKTIMTTGDSVTACFSEDWGETPFYGYQGELINLLGVNIDNKGVSGARISDGSWRPSLYVDRNTIDFTKADAITIMFGINEHQGGTGSVIGNIDSVNKDEYIGALKLMIEHIINANKDVLLILISPTYTTKADWSNGQSKTLHDYNNATREVADLYNLPYIDLLKELGVNNINSSIMLTDGTHPSDLYHKKIGTYIAKYIEKFCP